MKSKRKSPLKRVGTFFVVALLLFGTFLPGVFPWESGAEGEQAVTEDTVDTEESTFYDSKANEIFNPITFFISQTVNFSIQFIKGKPFISGKNI